MTRVREESAQRGTRPGVLVGLAVTGGVITSAGVVLAATFGALATLPILFLLQIAFIVAFGVLLDTLVVRSLLVPALATTSVGSGGRRRLSPAGRPVPDPRARRPGRLRLRPAARSTRRCSPRPGWRSGVSTSDPGRRAEAAAELPGCGLVSRPAGAAGHAATAGRGRAGQPDRRARRAGRRRAGGRAARGGRQAAGRRRGQAAGTSCDAARPAGVPLTVFQNRRWDAEQLTLRAGAAPRAAGRGLPVRAAVGTLAAAPKDRWRENAARRPGRRAAARPAQPPGRLRGRAVRPGARSTPVSAAHASEDDAFLACATRAGCAATWARSRWRRPPAPHPRAGPAGRYVVTAFEAEPTAFADSRRRRRALRLAGRRRRAPCRAARAGVRRTSTGWRPGGCGARASRPSTRPTPSRFCGCSTRPG